MDAQSINNITYRQIILPDKEQLNVSEIAKLIAWALYPSGANLIKAGITPLKLKNESPRTLRFLAFEDIEKRIRNSFASGDLQLRDFCSGFPIPKNEISDYNPFDCFISFDELVRFAGLMEVTVTAEAYINSSQNENIVYLSARDIAELTIKADGKDVTIETILKVAYQWVLASDSGWMMWKGNPDIQIQEEYATSDECLEALTSLRLIKLEDAILWGGVRKIPTERLKERLAQINLNTASQQFDDCLNAGADSQGREEPAISKPRKKRQPVMRGENNEGLLLIDELLERYSIEYLDELPAIKAWGKIISGEFTSNSFKQVSDSKKSIILASSEKLTKCGFLEKYRKRFKPESQPTRNRL